MDWNFPGVGGSMRPKNLKKCMKLHWKLQRGGEVLKQLPSMGEVLIFSGTTYYHKMINMKLPLSPKGHFNPQGVSL